MWYNWVSKAVNDLQLQPDNMIEFHSIWSSWRFVLTNREPQCNHIFQLLFQKHENLTENPINILLYANN